VTHHGERLSDGDAQSVFDVLGGSSPRSSSTATTWTLWRVRLGGLRVRHVPEAAVFHDKELMVTAFPPSPEEEYHVFWPDCSSAPAERGDFVDWWLNWARSTGASFIAELRRSSGKRPKAHSLTYREALGVSEEQVASVAFFHEESMPSTDSEPSEARPARAPGRARADVSILVLVDGRTGTRCVSSRATDIVACARPGLWLRSGGRGARDAGWQYVAGP